VRRPARENRLPELGWLACARLRANLRSTAINVPADTPRPDMRE
jgi:hypothetical protein